VTRTTTSPGEALAISAICFGWAILASTQAVAAGFQSEQFSDSGFVGLMMTELLFGMAAVLTLAVRGYAVRSLYPAPSMKDSGIAVILYLAAGLAAWVVVAPFAAGQGAQPIEGMVENASISLPVLVALGLVNGTYEEIFLLGFLLRGLRGYGLSVAIGVSLLVRVLYHLYQGPLGAVSVLAFGAVLSVYYVHSGRLFPAVLAHALADIVPFVWQ
jgi:uncharacterized protein